MEKHLAMILSGARLNGDFFLPSQASHLDMIGPHGTRLHDAIEAVKPLSPPESRLGDLIVAIVS
jgi:hypothetical protein